MRDAGLPASPFATHPICRLGFPVKVLAEPLRSHDSRRWQHAPHLSVSLAYLRDIFEYLHRRQIRFYRLAGQLAPYLTHPDLPAFHRQLEECTTELASTGDLIRAYGLRVTLHPAHYVQLNAPDSWLVRRAEEELGVAASLLEAMGLDRDAVIVVHVGGVHGNATAGRERFVARFVALPENVRRRLVLEHDDRRYSFEDALWIHRRTGIPVVLDALHLRCLNPAGRTLADALPVALATWPPDCRPKIHFSSPRTALRAVRTSQGTRLQPPLPNQHSDFLDPFAFIDLLHLAQQLHLRPFDVMLEAKAKDLALLRLREQLAHFAPQLANVVG
ncbi:MAG TPA: UV DNA damage repair endonuclease UvsE [Chloroflexi bacterium]|nr:UV DNA damage repair endonuclease UvsE [Chloroflexota bacterium]